MTQHLTQFAQSPPCTGPYSLGVRATGEFLFVSGQGPWDPRTRKFERGTVREQTRLTLENVRRIVEAAGARMPDVVSCRVYLQELTAASFAEMNSVYSEYWPDKSPARTTVGAQLLNIDVEIDCVAQISAP